MNKPFFMDIALQPDRPISQLDIVFQGIRIKGGLEWMV